MTTRSMKTGCPCLPCFLCGCPDARAAAFEDCVEISCDDCGGQLSLATEIIKKPDREKLLACGAWASMLEICGQKRDVHVICAGIETAHGEARKRGAKISEKEALDLAVAKLQPQYAGSESAPVSSGKRYSEEDMVALMRRAALDAIKAYEEQKAAEAALSKPNA